MPRPQREAAHADLIRRAQAHNLSLGEWRELLRGMSQDDLVRLFGQPSTKQDDYWFYDGEWIVKPFRFPKARPANQFRRRSRSQRRPEAGGSLGETSAKLPLGSRRTLVGGPDHPKRVCGSPRPPGAGSLAYANPKSGCDHIPRPVPGGHGLPLLGRAPWGHALRGAAGPFYKNQVPSSGPRLATLAEVSRRGKLLPPLGNLVVRDFVITRPKGVGPTMQNTTYGS